LSLFQKDHNKTKHFFICFNSILFKSIVKLDGMDRAIATGNMCTENVVTFGHVVFDIHEKTDRHTYIHTYMQTR